MSNEPGIIREKIHPIVWWGIAILGAVLLFMVGDMIIAERASAWTTSSCRRVYHSYQWWDRCWVDYSWWEEVWQRQRDGWKDFPVLTWGR